MSMAADESRVCLVTGASRGIGAAIALHLGKAGHRIIGSATTAEGAADISTRLQDAGIVGRGIVLRVDNSDSVAGVLEDIAANEGMPLVLVNNAGISRDNLLVRMKPDEWHDVIGTNLDALFRLSGAVVRAMMRARWGRIVNLSSVVARMGNAGQTNYVAAKAGIEGFTRALAREVASRNITVNAVAPGFIETDMTHALDEQQRERMRAMIPMGRLGAVDDVAALVTFLISGAASYVTGETIHVNGGMYMS